jgi:hypothetical protein
MKKFDMRKRNSQTERPRVPDWIRDFRSLGWTNIFDRLPTEEHLYGTETLFGDWNSRVLLLAKDWGPTSSLDEGIRNREARPWRHAQRGLGDTGGVGTNETLCRLASLIPGGKLYGSATANMLYDDPGWSRSLPGLEVGQLHDFLKRVLSWVLESMPQVQHVACLGNEAWFLTCSTIGARSSAYGFAEHRDSFQSVSGALGKKKISAFALYHPAARVSNESKETGWRALAASIPVS